MAYVMSPHEVLMWRPQGRGNAWISVTLDLMRLPTHRLMARADGKTPAPRVAQDLDERFVVKKVRDRLRQLAMGSASPPPPPQPAQVLPWPNCISTYLGSLSAVV